LPKITLGLSGKGIKVPRDLTDGPVRCSILHRIAIGQADNFDFFM
jgi:hypothetical protein